MQFENMAAEEALEKVLATVGQPERLVLCGDPEELHLLEEAAEYNAASAEEILAASASIDGAAWFAEREAQVREDYADEDEDVFAEIEGEWPGQLDANGITLNRDILTDELLPSVAVARLKVNTAWEIPAHFKFGGWNECPDPDVQCAVWKYWQEKYGAHIVGLSNDVIEAVVERPPTTQDEAMQLAWQQYWYCADVVDQGVETVANLAGCLLNGKTWYFWWD